MQRLVKPNPVAAMLDIVRESLPFARARSFTWPVLGLASFQKKLKLTRWISSSSCSAVPSNGAPLGATKDGEALFWQLARAISGEANRRIPQMRISSLLVRKAHWPRKLLLVIRHPVYFVISSAACTPCVESGAIHKVTLAGSTVNFCWSFQMAKAFGPRRKLTFLVSPGAMVMR